MADQTQAPQVAAPVIVAEQPKVEKQANCITCNKPIKKLKRYYRDGKFYCAKKCYKDFLEKQKAEKKQ
ncbi:MAG: hypothetical protein ABSE81_01750 [Candidatus Omnitrophota bacterium]|jgi:hypothetical protein